MATLYQYPRSLDETHIRVLHVTSAEGPQLVCSLEEIAFDKNDPGLEALLALSYCWGTDAPTESILIDDQLFCIRPNLLEALEYLIPYAQDRDLGPRFWIDAVCINQNDDQEKGAQLDLMSDIYSKMTVWVWLGPSANGSDELLSVLSVLGMLNEDYRVEELSNPDPVLPRFVENIKMRTGLTLANLVALERYMISDRDLDDKEVPATLPSPDHPLWRWFLCLFDRPWFTRVWTLQEVELPNKEPTIYCGSFWCQWNILRRCLSRLTIESGGIERISTQSFRDVIESKEKFEKLMSASQSYSTLDHAYQSVAVLRHKLLFAHARKATNPKDYVYGYLGLAPPQLRRQMIKNYDDSKWSVADVFTQAVGLCCKSWGTDDEEFALTFWPMLMEAKYYNGWETNRLVDLPSWCPDFSADRALASPLQVGIEHLQQPLLQCSRQIRAMIRDNTLTIAGFHLDCVQSCTGSTITTREGEAFTQSDQMIEAIKRWLKGLSDTFDNTAERQWLHQYFRNDAVISMNRITEDLDTMMQIFKGLDRSSEEEISLRISDYDRLYQSLITPMKRNMDCYFFSTANGKMGSSFRPLAPGDFVCYFPGSRRYSILSPLYEEAKYSPSQRYVFVGLADIPDYMGDWLINQALDWEFQDFTIT